MSLEKVLSAVGRAFIAAGVLVFLFVAFQLWGTNISEARSQDKLKADATKQFAVPTTVAQGTATTATTQATPNTTPAPPPAPQGAAIAVMQIPKINMEKAVVEGTGVSDLKKGPGHYTNTPLPGQPGNAAIAGHRTTYGAPFGDIGELVPGDEIIVTTKQGTFHYKVSGSKIVAPNDVSVLEPTKDNRLTLTTCHPKYSASKRLVVTAMLDTNPAPASTAPPVTTAPLPTGTNPATVSNPAAELSGADLSGTATTKMPTLIWGLLTALAALLIYVASRLWRRWPAYLLGAPIFLVLLFVFFENVSRLLPANA